MSIGEDPGTGRSRRTRRPSGDDRERALLATAERLLEELLPLLQRTAAEVSDDWALWQRRPHVELGRSPQT